MMIKYGFFTQIGETIADKNDGKALPAIRVEEPTVKMAFSINTSPFVGREVSYDILISSYGQMSKMPFGYLSGKVCY